EFSEGEVGKSQFAVALGRYNEALMTGIHRLMNGVNGVQKARRSWFVQVLFFPSVARALARIYSSASSPSNSSTRRAKRRSVASTGAGDAISTPASRSVGMGKREPPL